jgi:hypothetical protein
VHVRARARVKVFVVVVGNMLMTRFCLSGLDEDRRKLLSSAAVRVHAQQRDLSLNISGKFIHPLHGASWGIEDFSPCIAIIDRCFYVLYCFLCDLHFSLLSSLPFLISVGSFREVLRVGWYKRLIFLFSLFHSWFRWWGSWCG